MHLPALLPLLGLFTLSSAGLPHSPLRLPRAPQAPLSSRPSSRKSTSKTVSTPFGSVTGASDGPWATRYTLPYALPPVGSRRWADPVLVSAFNSTPYDASSWPPPCPQDAGAQPATGSADEDCLYANVWVPPNLALSGRGELPAMVWVHGGSLIEGSTTSVGLDGALLAWRGEMVVVTVQYRLGVLGWLRTNKAQMDPPLEGNYGLKDLITSLTFLNKILPSFAPAGHTSAKPVLTLAGQSSGASLLKTLMSTPSADDLFDRVAMHSSVLDEPDYTVAIAEGVGNLTVAYSNCTGTPAAVGSCLRGMDVAGLLATQDATMEAMSNGEGVLGEDASVPWQPVVDGDLVKADFYHLQNGQDGGLSRKDRPIVITTVKNEACATISAVSSVPIPESYFKEIVEAFTAPPPYRARNLLKSGMYNPNVTFPGDLDAVRDTLELAGTDYQWRCPCQQAAVNLTATGQAQAGVWLAEFNVGVPYPDMSDLYCDNKVAHQDDIPMLFANGPLYPISPSAIAASLELVARWVSLTREGSVKPTAASVPGPAWDLIRNLTQLADWQPVKSSTDLNMLQFGGATGGHVGAATVNATQRYPYCGVGQLWGTSKVPFDEQLYS